jgi:CubicO group peptidase (beta-lactamase class C family)
LPFWVVKVLTKEVKSLDINALTRGRSIIMKVRSWLFLLMSSILVLACSQDQQTERLSWVSSLFTGAEQAQNFDRAYSVFPTSRLRAATTPRAFQVGSPVTLPKSFDFSGQQVQVDEFLERTDTSALLILKEGQIAYESYWLTGGPDVQWISMSVAKSFISALVGIAVNQGFIESIEDPVTKYVPQLNGSAYNNVSIKNILQMSSGASWNEDYGDPESDINRSARILAVGGSLDEFSASLVNELEPGTYNRYNSTDTQVLGMLLREVAGTSVSEYMQQQLWDPMGAESDAFWLLDSEGVEMAYGGLNATARDYAKLGELYRQKGKANGRQVVPSSWIQASITPDAPHLLPGDNPLSDFPLGYGYQWWIPDTSGDYAAIGVYNQFIYVAPKRGMVIVKLSANSAYGLSEEASAQSEFESLAFFKALTR